MKVVIINKSDSTGGAAVVSRRLMEALRAEGVDARMLVCEKLTDSPFVERAASPGVIKGKFLDERLRIFFANGLNRKTLFKIDTGEVGLPLWKHPLVKQADSVLLNWVNQGMLSLKGVKKILELGKPVIWTMHDMWCMTGICHHAGNCSHFKRKCGECPLLGKGQSTSDLSYKIWSRKEKIYSGESRLAFVAVSDWLKGKARESSLLSVKQVEVIPNAFNPVAVDVTEEKSGKSQKTRILFGAVRLDDPIKGLDTLKAALEILKNRWPREADNMVIAVFGNVKNPDSLHGFSLPLLNLGILKGEEAVAKAYRNSDILVSASSYETLPGTLVEAQAYGVIPVSFNQGGQSDITQHLSTGYIAQYSHDPVARAENLAQGIVWAYQISKDADKIAEMKKKMRENVKNKFSPSEVARQYISLIGKL